MYWPLAGILLAATMSASAAAQRSPPASHDLRFSPDTTSAFDLLHPRYFVRVVEVAPTRKVYAIADPTTNRESFGADTTAERVSYLIDRNSNIGVRFDKMFINFIADFDAEVLVTARVVSGTSSRNIEVRGYSDVAAGTQPAVATQPRHARAHSHPS